MFCTEVVEVRVERRVDPGSGWRLRLRDLQCGAEREIRADLVILTGVREQVTSHKVTKRDHRPHDHGESLRAG